MCLIKLLRKLYNPEAAKEVFDDAEPELVFESTTKPLGSYVPNRGHKMYSYDFRTREVLLVEPELIEAKGPKGEKIFKKKIQFKPGMLYVSALNMKNAIEHIKSGKFVIPKK